MWDWLCVWSSSADWESSSLYLPLSKHFLRAQTDEQLYLHKCTIVSQCTQCLPYSWLSFRQAHLYRSDSRSVNWRAISIGWRVMRSKVSTCPGRLMCHSIGGGGLWKVMLWLMPLDCVCIFRLMILLIDSTHLRIDLPENRTLFISLWEAFH